jgi:hypothetical protein
VLGGAHVCVRRLLAAPREPEMARDRRGGRPLPAQRVRGASVQQPAAREARLLVGQHAQLVVREVVLGRALADQATAHQLLDRVDGLLVVAAADGARRVDVERPPDHRRRREHLASGLAHRREPRAQQLARPHGQHLRRPVAQRAEVLREQQRQPLRRRVELLRLPRLGELGHIVEAQPLQPPDRPSPRSLGLRDDGAQAVLVRRPPRQEHEQRPAGWPPQAVCEQPERSLVGPLHVVEQQDARRGPGGRRRQHLPHAVQEARLRARAVERRRRRQPRARLRQRAHEPRGLAQRTVAHGVQPARVLEQPAAQRLRHRAVGERRLLLVSAPGQRRGAARPCVREQLLGEPRLADPRLSLDDRDRAVAADRLVGLEQRLPVRLPAHERLRRSRTRGERRAHGRRGDRALADRLVQPCRLLERRHPELTRQRADALPVLVERRRAVAAQGVQAHQAPVGGLVQRVELEHPPRVADPVAVLAGRLGGVGQARERGGQLALERARLRALPVVVAGRVTQPEALHELAAEQLRRAREVALGRQRAEAVHVDVDAAVPHQPHAVTPGLDRLGADRAAQRGQRPPQRAARVLRVVLGPQQLGQRVARARAVDEREVRQQRERLARVERDRLPVALDARRAEQHHLDSRHRATP